MKDDGGTYCLLNSSRAEQMKDISNSMEPSAVIRIKITPVRVYLSGATKSMLVFLAS